MTSPEDPDAPAYDYSTPKPQQPPPGPPPAPPPGQYGPPAAYGQPVYYPPGYPGPYAYPPVATRRTNGFAIASFVCALAGFVTGCTAPLAIIFGFIARSQIKRTGEDGDGFALAGIIIGSVVVAGFVVLILVLVAVSRSTGPTY